MGLKTPYSIDAKTPGCKTCQASCGHYRFGCYACERARRVRVGLWGIGKMEATPWGTKCVSPPCLTATAAWNHAPEPRK